MRLRWATLNDESAGKRRSTRLRPHDLGAAHFDRADTTKTANRLIHRLQQLGYAVQATPAG